MRTYEDFSIGDENSFGGRTVTKQEIITFAELYDPQPFHLDEEAAKQSIVGALCASGWHTVAIMSDMIMSDDLRDVAVLGIPTVHEVRWKKPLLPGTPLTIKRRMDMKAPELGRNDRGRCRFSYQLLNDEGEILAIMDADIMIKRREVIL